MNDRENLEKLKKENFDLGLTEIFEACGFNIFKVIGLKKYIALSGSSYSAMLMDMLGLPIPLSYTPGIMSSTTDEMTFLQRFKNFFTIGSEIVIGSRLFIGGAEDAMKDVYDPNYDIKEQIKDSTLFFVNSDEVVDYALPITPKVIYIGGMGKVQSKPLDKVGYLDCTFIHFNHCCICRNTRIYSIMPKKVSFSFRLVQLSEDQ